MCSSGPTDPSEPLEPGEIPCSPQPYAPLDYSKLCQTCVSEEWRYTCPRCSLHSCSLACVQRHKQERGCSGERDRCKHVPIREYNENTFYSDNFFLEDVRRVVDRSDRDRTHEKISKNSISRLLRLKAELRKRGTVFYFAPAGMAARARNRTNFYSKQGIVFWYLRLVFEGSKTGEFFPSGVSERTLLRELVLQWLGTCEEEESLGVHSRAVGSWGPGALQAKLAQPGGMVLLDMDRSLMDNLRNCRVMEYPSITVIVC